MTRRATANEIGRYLGATEKNTVINPQGHITNYTFVPKGARQTCASASENGSDYYPYGSILREVVNAEGQERYLSTHHERDVQTGLDYRGARYYDSDVARFLSLDPLAADYASWSPYNYVVGDPINYTDPNGTNANPVYSSTGEYRGDTKEGFTGEVLIYDGSLSFGAMSKDELIGAGANTYDEVRGSLAGSAKSSIWSGIVEHFEGMQVYNREFSMSKMTGGKVHFGGPGNWSTNMTTGKISGSDSYGSAYETTVENIASSLIVHEWLGHKEYGHRDRYDSHRLCYKNVINFKELWNKTTDKYKRFNLEKLQEYTLDETGRTTVDPPYRRLYERYVGP